MAKYPIWLGLCVAFSVATAGADDRVQLKYRFSPGQVLRFDGKQTMNVESTVSGTTQKFSSETTSLREWRVESVDDDGNARLQMVIVRAKVAATAADGSKFAFDTAADGNAGPLAGIVGKPLVELNVAPTGRIASISESKQAGAGQFVAHVRTLMYALPSAAVEVGATWHNDIELPLPPPVGKGETVRLRQTFRLEKVSDSVATINLANTLAEDIKDKARMTAIVQFLPSGKIEFDMTRGIMRSVDLTLDQKISEFAGSDSTMHVTGSNREVLKDELAKQPN